MSPSTSKAEVGLLVPIPTLPSTIKPLVGAVFVPEYVEPTATPPSTSSLFCGEVVPIPTSPLLKSPWIKGSELMFAC